MSSIATTPMGEPARPISAHTFDASGGLVQFAGLVIDAFAEAGSRVTLDLGAEGIDVIVINAPDQTIPEWGVGGYTYGPNLILVALDPEVEVSKESLVRTLLHEFHHAMRWRSEDCGADLAAMLVSEGLAQLFEEEVLGTPPTFARTPIGESEIARARRALFEQPFKVSRSGSLAPRTSRDGSATPTGTGFASRTHSRVARRRRNCSMSQRVGSWSQRSCGRAPLN